MEPCGPVSPRGMVKVSTTFSAVPDLVTEAFVPGAPVIVCPTVILGVTPLVPAGP